MVAHPPFRVRLLFLLVISLSPAGCFVNPVPTPETNSTVGGGGGTTDTVGGVAGDTASLAADAKSASDAATDSAAQSVVTPVPATQTDAAITAGIHLTAVNLDVATTGKLVLILPDVGRQPADYQALAQEAAGAGHRVLVLAWPNATSANSVCQGETGCTEAARKELLDGQDRTPKVTISPQECIEFRAAKALEWLAKNRPGEGWSTLYAGSAPVWGNAAVIGHGEGAGQAAMVGVMHKVWRVVLLAGPTDGQGAIPATWLNGQHATAATAWRAFAHTTDPQWSMISAAWTALGLGSGASALSMDSGQAPGISTQLLTISAVVADPQAAVAVDGQLPADTQTAQHVRAAWKFLVWPY